MTGRLVWHDLDVGPPAPDWGQRHDGPRPEPGPAADVTFHVADPEPADPDPDPEPDITFYVAESESDPDPEPNWDQLRGDGVTQIETPLPDPDPPRARHNAARTRRKVVQDPLPRETPGGLIRRSRERMGSHRGDLEAQEMRAWLLEPDWVRLTKRRNNAHWLWR